MHAKVFRDEMDAADDTLTRVSSCSMKLVALPSDPQAALLQPACSPATAVPNPLSSFVSSSLLCSWVVRCERSAVRPRQWPRVAALRGVLVLASVRQPSSLPPLQQGKVQSGNVQPTSPTSPSGHTSFLGCARPQIGKAFMEQQIYDNTIPPTPARAGRGRGRYEEPEVRAHANREI